MPQLRPISTAVSIIAAAGVLYRVYAHLEPDKPYFVSDLYAGFLLLTTYACKMFSQILTDYAQRQPPSMLKTGILFAGMYTLNEASEIYIGGRLAEYRHANQHSADPQIQSFAKHFTSSIYSLASEFGFFIGLTMLITLVYALESRLQRQPPATPADQQGAPSNTVRSLRPSPGWSLNN